MLLKKKIVIGFVFIYGRIPLIQHPAGPGKMQCYQNVPKFYGQPSEKVPLSVIIISW